MARPSNRTPPTHAAPLLPSVEVLSYNLELEDDEGFIGDKARTSAFHQMLEEARESLRPSGEDPFGEPQAAAVVLSAVEAFARELAGIIRRFLRLAWRHTECI